MSTLFDRISCRKPTAWSVVAGLLAGVLAAGATAGTAFAQEDEAFDTRIMRQILRGIGLRSSSDPQIDYRERPPLVVPPGRNLPPPQSQQQVNNNPAWPNDPDVKQRRQAAKRGGNYYSTAYESWIENSRVLTPAEMAAGRRNGPDDFSNPAPTAEESATPSRPSQLGVTGNVFRSIWSTVAPAKDEVETFTQEPPRATLTQPPQGYQTPSPAQPYGVTKRNEKQKPVNTYIDLPSAEY